MPRTPSGPNQRALGGGRLYLLVTLSNLLFYLPSVSFCYGDSVFHSWMERLSQIGAHLVQHFAC